MKIIEAIKNANISNSQINNIYFGQIEFEQLANTNTQSCIKIDNICLSYIDDLLAQIPAALKTNIDNSTNIDNIKLSMDKIYISSSSKYIDTKTSYILSAILVLFSVFTFAKVINNKQITSEIPNKIESLQQHNNMPSTILQTKSIIKKLQKISNHQSKIRELFEYVLSFKKIVGGTMVSMNFKNDDFILKFKDIKAQKLTNYLEKKYALKSAVVKDGIITIGLKL